MKKSYTKSKKNFLALLLSVLMVTSCVAVAACKDTAVTEDSSSSSSQDTNTSVNDTGLIKNANFQTADTDDGLKPIVTSVTGWTRSVYSSASGSSASSSTTQSGIIDTDAEAWDDLTRFTEKVEITEEEAKANWDKFSIHEKLAYYEYWKEQNPDIKSKISSELSDFYQSFNIDKDDVPTVANPGTHFANAEDAKDSNVLMIHNQTSKDAGTSQKYTSSSTVTVPAGAAAEFSVWVKTDDLQSVTTDNTAQDAVGKGAYISVTHSVGSKSLPAFEVKNINTEVLNPNNDNNGWVQYSFYLTASPYSDTTFSLVLGLGQGTSSERLENVNGYAFFDDIQCNVIDLKDSYDADVIVDFGSDKDAKTVDTFTTPDVNSFMLDFHGDFDADDLLNDDKLETSYTTGSYKNEDGYNAVKGDDKVLPTLKKGGFSTDNDVVGVYTLEEIKNNSNEYVQAIYNSYLVSDNEQGPWLKNDQEMLLIMSAEGVPYTVDSTKQFSFLNETDNVYEDYMLISFFVKTSKMNNFTGAGITLNDGENKTSFASIDTSGIAGVEIGDNEDYYDGWQQVFFFVENDFAENADGQKAGSFTLSFNYGLTDITNATDDSFYEGFAAFTGFEVYFMDKAEYEAANTGTYAKKVVVTGETTDEENTGNAGFDSAAIVPTDALKEGFANLQNYKGVYSDSYYVNQSDGTNTNVNQYKNAGLLNKNAFIGTDEEEGYFAKGGDLVDKMIAASGLTENVTAENVWNAVFGKETSQPLLIWNEDMDQSYGYIGSSKTIAANDYATISLRVKTNGASAYVYLIDMDDDTYSSTLSIGGKLVYWYDEDGNICTGDPEENSTQIAFLLQPNGLYKANAKWEGYEKLSEEDKTASFANLQAYGKDKNGNLIVADGGASHDYTKVNNDGNVIAFYAGGTDYGYADEAGKVVVKDLFSITKANADDDTKPLASRYNATENKDLFIEVGDTQGEWQIVTFYIHTGEFAKNYRLEVWSGSRDGSSVIADGSYVAFDVNNPGDVDSDFATLVDTYKDTEGAESFETIFSYFDTDKFLRYDSDLDVNNVGNLYQDSYDTTAQTEGVAYLKYTEDSYTNILVDYSLTDKTVVAASADHDHDHDHDHEDDHDHDHGSETNFLMLLSSIAIAVVLLFAIASIIIRKAVVSYRKKHGVKIKVKKAAPVKKVKPSKKKENDVDEDSPYND